MAANGSISQQRIRVRQSVLLRVAARCSGASPLRPATAPRHYAPPLRPQVGFYYTLLKRGLNVWACDADALFMSDPRPLMRTAPWVDADLAIATDCIDLPGDKRSPLLCAPL